MKKTLLALLLLVYIVSFTLPAFAMKNEPDNFRGIPWGTPAPPKDDRQGRNKWGLVSISHPLSTEQYIRNNDERSIGGAEVISIRYFFQESLGFARARVTFDGLENYKLIRKTCFFLWGKPDYVLRDAIRPDSKIEKFTGEEKEDDSYESLTYFWWGEKIVIELGFDNNRGQAGEIEMCLNNLYKISERDNAKYLQKHNGF